MITIREAAALADVSKDKCRYWLKLLDLEMVKQDGKLLLPGNAVNLLQAMKKAVDSGMAPVAAAVEVKSIHPLPVVEVHQDKQNNAADKIADLQKAVLLLASTVEKQNQALNEQSQLLSEQSKQLAALSTRLLPPPVAPTKKAAENIPLLRRLWLELFDPIQLRATP